MSQVTWEPARHERDPRPPKRGRAGPAVPEWGPSKETRGRCGDSQSEHCPVLFPDFANTGFPEPQDLLYGPSWAEPRELRKSRPPPLPSEEKESSPSAVLAALTDATTSRQVRRRMVIEAEVLHFAPSERNELNAVLRRFIEDYRNSDDPEDLVAVASAIRKYVATMNRDDVGTLAVLLATDQNATVPLEVELEVAKTLVRKLTAHPPEEPDSEPELGDRLADMTEAYLNARLLSREKYGAVALNAVLALLILRSRRMADLLPVLKELRVPWFTQLLVRRAARLRNDLSRRFSQVQAERYLESLNAMCDELATS